MNNSDLIKSAKEAVRNGTVLTQGVVDLLCDALAKSDEQLVAVVAENAALKLWASQSVELWDAGCEMDGHLSDVPRTVSTDSFLASLRAEGVEMALTGLLSYLNHDVDIDSMQTKWEVSSAVVEYINSQLRSQSEQVKGVQS